MPLMGKSTISMAMFTMFNCYVSSPEDRHLFHLGPMILTHPGDQGRRSQHALHATFATADRSSAQKDPYTACD